MTFTRISGFDRMRSIRRDTQFKRDVKLLIKRGKDMGKLREVIDCLVKGGELLARSRDHQLKGTLKDCRECHIEGDWLLIYRIEGSELCLVRTGSHSDLFG
jgi:mRNA interferase YafQ